LSATHIDARLVVVVTHANNLLLADPSERRGASRSELLRDRALLHLLFFTGAHRTEVASLNRGHVRGGYAPGAVIVDQGNKPRCIYFDDQTRRRIRDWLEARADSVAAVLASRQSSWAAWTRGRVSGGGCRRNRWAWGVVRFYAGAIDVNE
jgi:site-specific recombinase XerD